MLDVYDFIKEKGGDPDAIRRSQEARGASVEVVDEIIAEYANWVKVRFALDDINKQQNAIQKEIKARYKSKTDASDLIKQKDTLNEKKEEILKQEQAADQKLKDKLNQVGNLVHESVVVSKDEANNEIIRTWGSPSKTRPPLSHDQVLTRLDGYDPERGTKVVGHRGYFLKQYGVFLNNALIQYGIDFLYKQGYTPLQPPAMLNKDVMAQTAQLSQFDEELYKVVDGKDEKYLIATSEQPISAYHSNEWFDKPEEQLPIRYAGYSSCFRREAGSHGKDTWGIFRVHEFQKIEQFCITEPGKSWEEFDRMIDLAEKFYQSLGLPYRVVSIVSGELNNAASKKYDLEAWFPFQQEFKELVSCSNCTDYQSRNLDIRCGHRKIIDRSKKFVHCLNSTLCATERALCCILENYQTEDGFNVPEVLRRFIPGEPSFIPFSVELKGKKKDSK